MTSINIKSMLINDINSDELNIIVVLMSMKYTYSDLQQK